MFFLTILSHAFIYNFFYFKFSHCLIYQVIHIVVLIFNLIPLILNMPPLNLFVISNLKLMDSLRN